MVGRWHELIFDTALRVVYATDAIGIRGILRK
jgi:hypothetical protein